MRCYLMRKGHIASVEFLKPGTDEALIEQSKACFDSRSDEQFDAFEVWDGARRVYVHPDPPKSN